MKLFSTLIYRYDINGTKEIKENHIVHLDYGETFYLSEFVVTTPPKRHSNGWHGLNQSHYEFAVRIENGKLEINEAEYNPKTELKLTHGTLIGIDHGEWGGRLTYLPLHSNKEVDIKSGNIKFIFPFKEKIYFIEGLAHLGMNSGALYELKMIDNKIAYTKALDFEDAPQAFTIYNDDLLIASTETFYLIRNFKKEIIFHNAFWGGLYPNSIAVLDENNVYLGMRSGIGKLDLIEKTIKFYKFSRI